MTYVLEPFKNEYREKIFLDLANQPLLQRMMQRNLPEDWLHNWATDRENNSYLYSIMPPGMVDEHWYQFFISGHGFRISIPRGPSTRPVALNFIDENRPPVHREFFERLQAAFDVYGRFGLGVNLDQSDVYERVAIACPGMEARK